MQSLIGYIISSFRAHGFNTSSIKQTFVFAIYLFRLRGELRHFRQTTCIESFASNDHGLLSVLKPIFLKLIVSQLDAFCRKLEKIRFARTGNLSSTIFSHIFADQFHLERFPPSTPRWLDLLDDKDIRGLHRMCGIARKQRSSVVMEAK